LVQAFPALSSTPRPREFERYSPFRACLMRIVSGCRRPKVSDGPFFRTARSHAHHPFSPALRRLWFLRSPRQFVFFPSGRLIFLFIPSPCIFSPRISGGGFLRFSFLLVARFSRVSTLPMLGSFQVGYLILPVVRRP